MTWGAPEWLILLGLAPLSVVLGGLWWGRLTRAMGAWAARSQWPRLGVDASRRRLALRLILVAVAISATALALSRPRWGQSEHTVERVGVDTVVILDSSTSMSVTDVTPSRIEVARALLTRLTERLDGHRLALLQMEGTVRALTPMTADLGAVRLALDAVRVGSLERPGTDLGLALERGAELFLPGEERHRAILVVTDGEDHGERMAQAQRQLSEQGIAVHVLAVGTPEGGPVPVPGAGPGVFKQDGQGEVVISRLAAEQLRSLAQVTGGQFVIVKRGGRAIDPVVKAILSLEARSLGRETVVQQRERFQIPLLAAVFALITAPLVQPMRPVKEAR